MSCREREEQVFLYAAGALEGEELETLRAHLDAGCTHCEAVRRRAEEDLTELLVGLSPVEPGPHVRERLLSRVRAAPAVPRRRTAAAARDLSVAALAGAAAAAVIAVAVLRDPTDEPRTGAPADAAAASTAESAALGDEIADLETDLLEQDAEIGRLERALADARDALELLRSPDVVWVDLAGTALQPDARARVFWDWEDYSCYFHAGGLERAAETTYALWLYTDTGDTLLAGTFRADDLGEASFFTLLPRDMGKVVRAVVSSEPGEPGTGPGGPIHLEQIADARAST